MTVIATDWELAEPAPADLVICCHVLYGVADAAAFIAKLESGRRRASLHPAPLRPAADALRPASGS